MQLFNWLKVKPLPICVYGHPALSRQSVDVTAINGEIRTFAERMTLTMREAEGIGLAAPQVGRNINLITLEVPPPKPGGPLPTSPGEVNLLPRMPMVMVNPKLTDFSEQTRVCNEGCLSLPGVDGDVERPEFVQVTFLTLDGVEQSFRCGGLLSRCIQHEVDHLNGKVFIEYIPEDQLATAEPTLEELKRRSARQAKKG